ncbi:MAG TPA: hypothetical protein VJZ73_13380 [Methylomirabilota bacterium]|nr:hypothetical protein [Methylomirabilota bacterium]
MSADLDALRRAIEMFILDEARRRGVSRLALHVDVAPMPDGKGGVDVVALVLDMAGEDPADIRRAVDAHVAAKKAKN